MTHLDEYVFRDDGMFSWYLHDVLYFQNVRVLLVNMTSQRWLDGTVFSIVLSRSAVFFVVLPVSLSEVSFVLVLSVCILYAHASLAVMLLSRVARDAVGVVAHDGYRHT